MSWSCRFELVEMLRKLVLIAVLAAIAEESTTYLNLAEVVSIGALYIFAYCKPFAEAEVNRLQTITLLVTSLTIFYGIMLNAPQGNVDSGDSNERTAKARPYRMRCQMQFQPCAACPAGHALGHHERRCPRAPAGATVGVDP